MSDEQPTSRFWTFNIGHAIQLAGMLAAALAVITTLKGDVQLLGWRLQSVETAISKIPELVSTVNTHSLRLELLERTGGKKQ